MNFFFFLKYHSPLGGQSVGEARIEAKRLVSILLQQSKPEVTAVGDKFPCSPVISSWTSCIFRTNH